MDIIFIHGNYPGQFRHLAQVLGQDEKHRVIFLTNREDAETIPIAGVEIRIYKLHRKPNNETHHYLRTTEDAILKGQAVIRCINDLLIEGYTPQLVITHAGMGLGLFIKDILPKAIHIGLFEWYFRKDTAKWLMLNYELNQQLLTRIRNLVILEELNSCDAGVVPTNWQKSQFPQEYLSKLEVIFDGIDTNFFKSNKKIDKEIINISGEDIKEPLIINKEDIILSYATRGMETIRGFSEFMEAAINAAKSIDKLKIIIAGRDRRAYSYGAPSHEGSWKNHILDTAGDFTGKEKINFMGLMPYGDYRKLLQRSNLHCYFTRPYVTSWSLFEAASSGARLCVNRCKATEGIIENQEDVCWVNLDKQTEVNELIINSLNNGLNRSQLKNEYNLQNSMHKWKKLINNLIN